MDHETGGAVVRGSDWQSQDREFKPHWRLRICAVLLSKALNPNYSVVQKSRKAGGSMLIRQ